MIELKKALGELRDIIHRMFVRYPVQWSKLLLTNQNILYTLPMIFIAIVASTPIIPAVLKRLEHSGSWVKILFDSFVFCMIIVSIIVLSGETFNPFIYYRF